MNTLEQLELHRRKLAEIEALQSNWSRFETWAAGIRPFLRRQFPDDLADFEAAVQPPKRVLGISFGNSEGEHPKSKELAKKNLVDNNKLTQAAKERVLALLDGLIQASAPPVQATTLVRLPFRPYKRFVARGVDPREGFARVQLAALQAEADEAEVKRAGGHSAVLASILRHLPDFKLEDAGQPCGPAWMKLKPVLVRCGLNPTDDATLPEIKAFLDDVPAATSSICQEVQVADNRNVFVIHGRNLAARIAMFDFLRALGLKPLEWEQAAELTKKGAPYVGEVVDAAFANARAVVAILTGDDLACLRPEFQQAHDPHYEKTPTPQARPNVLFEAGMAFGSHPDQTILVQIGEIRPFSDTAGRHVLHFTGSPENRTTLRDRLKNLKCDVSPSGTDWLSKGDFAEALRVATANQQEGNGSTKKPRKRKS